MSRAYPGILTNSEYGRKDEPVYPIERHHNVHWHKSFCRHRGGDATK